MFFKSTLILAIMALSNIAIAAQTPGCLLGVIGNTPNPDDMPTICGSKDMQSSVSNQCGAKSVQYFANMCKAAGYKVDMTTTVSSSAAVTGFVTSMSTVSGVPVVVTVVCKADCTGTTTGVTANETGSSGGSGSGTSGGSDTTAKASGTESTSTSSPTSSTSFNSAANVQFSISLLVAGIFVSAAALL